MQTTQQTPQTRTKQDTQTLQAILEELHLLRKEVHFLFPQEEIDDYSHPERIRQSYKKALKQYPPASAL
jgi:hypothetical protein